MKLITFITHFVVIVFSVLNQCLGFDFNTKLKVLLNKAVLLFILCFKPICGSQTQTKHIPSNCRSDTCKYTIHESRNLRRFDSMTKAFIISPARSPVRNISPNNQAKINDANRSLGVLHLFMPTNL